MAKKTIKKAAKRTVTVKKTAVAKKPAARATMVVEAAPVSKPVVKREPILTTRNLVKRYGRVTALDHANFDLYPGEVLATTVRARPR
jgi:ABC-type glutathione transport system ATPase component